MSFESILSAIKTYGIGLVLLALAIYVILKGEFTLRYPRADKKKPNDR